MSIRDFRGSGYFAPIKPGQITVVAFGSGGAGAGGGGIAPSAKAEMVRNAQKGVPDGRIGMSIGEHIQKVLGPDHYADEVKLPVDWDTVHNWTYGARGSPNPTRHRLDPVAEDMVRGTVALPQPLSVHTDRAADIWRAERESYRDMIQKLLVRNMQLENELKQSKQRLSFSWEHLPDVATPEPKIKPMPVNALRPRQRHPMPWLKLPD